MEFRNALVRPAVAGVRCRCAVVAILLVLASAATAGEIRIGSFNIANLGATDEFERSLIDLTNVIRRANADVLAIQEVQPSELGRAQVARLVDLLNLAAKHDGTELYEYAIAEDHTGDELAAFIWRSPVALESEIWLLDHEVDPDQDGKPTFQRVPSVGWFTAGDLGFYLVNCHLYTKVSGVDSEGRGEELAALATWLKALEDEGEPNAVVVGDFNRFCKGKKAWKKIMPGGYADHYRFPLLEAIAAAGGFDPEKDDAPEDRFSTTTSKSRNIYDQIVVSKGMFGRVAAAPVFGTDVGIEIFDDDPDYAWFIDNWHNATKMLSDHRPVWVRVEVALP